MPKHDLEYSNKLYVQGKSKMDISCVALNLFYGHHEFLQGEWMLASGSELQIIFFYLLPGGLAPFQPVNWCYFRLIFWPWTPSWQPVPLFAQLSVLTQLWRVLPCSRPGQPGGLGFLVLTWLVLAGRIRPPNKKTNYMGHHYRAPRWRFAAAGKHYRVSASSGCLYQGAS